MIYLNICRDGLLNQVDVNVMTLVKCQYDIDTSDIMPLFLIKKYGMSLLRWYFIGIILYVKVHYDDNLNKL